MLVAVGDVVRLSGETCAHRVAAFTSETRLSETDFKCRIRHGCIVSRQRSTCHRLRCFCVENGLLGADVQKPYFCCTADADIDCVLDVLPVFSRADR